MPSRNSSRRSSGKIKLRGSGVSSGVSIGHVQLFHVSNLEVGESVVLKNHIEPEIQRFQDAIAQTCKQIEELGKRVTERGEDKALIEVLTLHLLLLEDKMIYDRTIELVREKRYGAEYALTCVYREAEERYSELPDLFRERIKDVEDICRRIMNNLCGVDAQSLEDVDEEVIIVAHDLSPSDTASMRRDNVLGFVTEAGGKTSHTAIIARALEIPAVVGVSGITKYTKDHDAIIIDGESGSIIVNPTSKDINEYRDKQHRLDVRQSRLIELSDLEPYTLDGFKIELAANIEFASEVESIAKYRANGVGLYRTEYLFLDRSVVPSEKEQYKHYFEVTEKIFPDPVIIRTLDIGGDKFAHALDTPHEMNPFLGCRAIRFSLTNKSIFRTQLRAILRASTNKNLLIMYPLISGHGELMEAKEHLEAVKDELRSKGVSFDENIKVGAMIEVPSAVMVAQDLAKHVDFFSIGTNDLIQYTLAVDRGNENIAYLYQPFHPAVLRMIYNVVEIGREYRIPVSICGEMASDPMCVLVLLALGIERLSMAPNAIPSIKQLVRSISIVRLREFGSKILSMSSAEEIKMRVIEALPKLLAEGGEEVLENLNESSILASS